MTDTIPEYDLQELLDGSPAGSFELTDEDRAWLSMRPAGQEYGTESGEDE